jgi:nucleotidyltransferase/DNA polymerase involved in DNA repair
VETLPVGKFHGIGPATSAKMNALGIFTGMDMRKQTLEFMNANFGKAGAYYYWISRGVDERPVRADRIRKSVGAENTFSTDLSEFDAMVAELEPLIDKVWRHCEGTGNRGRTVTLKVRRLRDHHAKPIRFIADREPRRSCASGDRPPGERHSPSEGGSPLGSLVVFPAGRGRH